MQQLWTFGAQRKALVNQVLGGGGEFPAGYGLAALEAKAVLHLKRLKRAGET